MPQLYLIAVIVLLVSAIGSGWTGYRIGKSVQRTESTEARLAQVDRILVKKEKETVVEKKIETKFIQSVMQIHTSTEEIRHEIPSVVSGNCVLPPDFMRSLRALSRGKTVATSGEPSDQGEGAGCHSVLDLLAKSYGNHYADAEQLNSLLQREEELAKIR